MHELKPNKLIENLHKYEYTNTYQIIYKRKNKFIEYFRKILEIFKSQNNVNILYAKELLKKKINKIELFIT